MRIRAQSLALLCLSVSAGCASGTGWFYHDDPTSRHEPGSEQWWAEKGELPPGVRQSYHKGKVWPARPRSTAPKQQFSHIYHSQHYWPLPYTCQDQQAVWSMIDTQTALGWQQETTLFDHHFDAEGQQLNSAGQRHLEYILFHVPESRRSVYVQSTHSEVHNAVRMTAVEDAVATFQIAGEPIPVTLRDCRGTGRPAAEIQAMSDMYRESIPTPRLGNAGGGGSGATGAGGGFGTGGGGGGGTGGGTGGSGGGSR